ncbi:ABC transporter permease [Acidaminobacter sp. JC074]|uniref:ABC transporter permease n=1 Tax=Acidaminobacter sp. JC074 TaxID=2530199 RepID=UPI001F0DBB30|nr:ABC transporter permease subunit [Acidaminobacter sp. JC074]
MKKNKILEGSLILLFWMFVWWLISSLSNDWIIPSPITTFQHVINLLFEGQTYIIIASSLMRVFIALIVGIVLGVGFGLLSGMNELIRRTIHPLILVIKSTPVVSFIIILILYAPKGVVPIICGILLCFPIIHMNVYEGYRMVDKQLISMSNVYKVPFKRRLRMLYLPSALPYLFAGVLTSIGICWKATIAAEVIGVLDKSIGLQMYNGKVYLDFESVFAWTVIIVICSLLIEMFAKQLIKRIQFYERFKEV